ncbi:aminotransferase class I/II-fold pyridoxal phosphate-dependent enzyme [uncultured Ruegeria sp.]|uniref:aminotransferase class I/II-fold pyridoxal phosphate-dependent enzyme n=1 Tax=uncultured Ruegeria sp. TaxID=259304 RepID=UPI002624DF2A|nr:aminotransferase class I/II-fold pyridoxal phosphate-dependent enzyme [uncultured Ruegeria sp.]
MIALSSRLDPIKPSASAWVSQAANEARSRGEDVIDLGLGERDFDTPEHIKHAAHAADMAGQTKYPPTSGTLALRKAVADKLRREKDLAHGVDEFIVANGAKQVIFNAMRATLEDGDEVLLCAPYFGQYKDIVLILGGRPVTIPCVAENRFRLQPGDLVRAITARTRWIILNLPSNPAGAVYSDDDLRSLGVVLADHPQVMILSDEIDEHILFNGRKFRSFAAINSDLKDRTLTVNGVSKAYAMTGIASAVAQLEKESN